VGEEGAVGVGADEEGGGEGGGEGEVEGEARQGD